MCSVEVTFKPTAVGEVSGTVTLTDSVGGVHTVTIQGNGVNQGVISAVGAHHHRNCPEPQARHRRSL